MHSFSWQRLLFKVGLQHHSEGQDFHFSGYLEAVCNLRLGAIWEGKWWNVIPAYSLTRFQHSFWNRATYWIFLQALCVIFSAAGRTARDCPLDSDGGVRCCRMQLALIAESHHSSLNAECKIYNLLRSELMVSLIYRYTFIDTFLCAGYWSSELYCCDA